MNRFIKLGFALTLAAVLAHPACAQPSESTDTGDNDARFAQILENLKLQFPQLGQAVVEGVEIGPSDYDGLDEGTFNINGKPQKFLVTSDTTMLYMLAAEPIDVSRSAEEIVAEKERQAAEAAKAGEERAATLAAAVEGTPMRGNPDAPVTIIEFSDFQCPYCKRGADTVEEILEKYPNDVKFQFAHFPLNFHPWAKPASVAAVCASNQSDDAFWTLHDAYFENQSTMNVGNVVDKSKEFLADSGIDIDAFATCAGDTDSDAHKAATAVVDAQMAAGQQNGVSGTPGFFVNGQFLNGAQPLSAFEPLIEAAKGSES